MKGASNVTQHQLKLWRGEGLLPRVLQCQIGSDGSIVFYPAVTCDQIAAIQRLLAQKQKFEYVGWELWWQGFDVAEKHWKPLLQTVARTGDRLLRIIRLRTRMDDKLDAKDTLADRVTNSRTSNILFSRVVGRLTDEELASVLGTQ
jgi:hypothetical protein